MQVEAHIKNSLDSSHIPVQSEKQVSALLDHLADKRDSWHALRTLGEWVTAQLKKMRIEEAKAARNKASLTSLLLRQP